MGQLIKPPKLLPLTAAGITPIPLRAGGVRDLTVQEWFGPLEPLLPTAPPGTQPRQWEFLPGQNITWVPRADEAIGFQDLIYMSENCDLVRIVIESLKDQICIRPWQVRVVAIPGETQRERAQRSRNDPRVPLWTDFLQWPNPENAWCDWLRMLLEDLLVLDAPSILLQRTRKGDIGALRVIDGQTINRIIDDNGFTPLPPDSAYQQILYGQPAVDLTTDDLVYRPRNLRARKMFGFSPVEQIMTTLNIAVRRTRFQLANYTEGNVPEALYTMPGSVTEDNVRKFQSWFDTQLAGNLALRRRIWFIPGDDKGVNRLHWTKEALLKDDADEWFARIICFAFRISPKELIKAMNRATAAESQDSTEEQGVHSICQWVADTINYIIQRKAGHKDIEFVFSQKREADALKQAQADKIYVDTGIVTRNELREDLGSDPSQDPNADVLGVTTGLGFIPLGMNRQDANNSVASGSDVLSHLPPAPSPDTPAKKPSSNGKPAPAPKSNARGGE
jgi:hypothetical protein